MKRFTLLSGIFLFAVQFLFAQDYRAPGEIIVSDDFSVPSNWTAYTESDTDPEWEIVLSTPENMSSYMFEGGEFSSPTAENGFAVFDGITYLVDEAVVPIDALLEYQGEIINCEEISNVILEFYITYRPYNYDQLFLEITSDDWDTFEAIELYSEALPNSSTISEFQVIDISSMAGGMANVKIRFRFKELIAEPLFGAGYGVCVDDFKISEAWDFDQKITASYHRSGLGLSNANGLEYFIIPPDQVTEIFFAGKTQNMGGLVQPNAKFNAVISGAGTYAGSSTPVNLPVGSWDSLGCTTSYTPEAIGNYEIVYWFDSEEEEQETNNDTMYSFFTVTPYYNPIYARDNGIVSGSISNLPSNDHNPVLIGNTMDIFSNDYISAVDIQISNDFSNIDQEIFAQVMLYDEDSEEFIYKDQTDDHMITSGENGTAIRLYLDDCIEVFENQTILVLAGHYGGDEVEFSMAQPTDEGTVLGYKSGETEPFILPNPKVIMVRPFLYKEPCWGSIADNESSIFTIAQNMPNPFDLSTTINYELYSAAEVSFELSDITGKVVRTIRLGNKAPGSYELVIEGADLADGIYFYTFGIGNESFTKRMVVRH